MFLKFLEVACEYFLDANNSITNMRRVKEIKGLKCPNHEYQRDNHNFTYEETFPGAQPLSSTRCVNCGYTKSQHKVQKV